MRKQAFSLVELSIVLVILGLLVGGVLSGQSLIRAAELRSVSTQYNGYMTAVRGFRDKYFAIPGDMTNATSFWGTQAVGAACATTLSSDAKTCDGDGNGKVYIIGASDMREYFRLWQHLANAGLIEGRYDGVSFDQRSVPMGKLSGSFWFVEYDGTQTSVSGWFNGVYNNVLVFYDLANGTGILTPTDAWNIDAKMDDGKPATGKLVAFSYDGLNGLTKCTDAVGANPALSATLTANYLQTQTAKECNLAWPQAF